METYYNIGYAVVSLIFLSNAGGFITAAFVSQAIYSRIGRAKTLLIGILLECAAFLIIACAPPWGVVVASFFLIGGGMALVCIFPSRGERFRIPLGEKYMATARS